jgi:DNA-binding MarR family transcriptional regulator
LSSVATNTANATSITERPTFLVHRLNAELARVCNPLFRRLGVDLITSRILVILREQQFAYVGDIVEAMSLPQSTVSHQLTRLEASGLVTRRADKADNRAFVLSLTRKGQSVAQQCNELSDNLYAQLFAEVDANELAALISGLERMEQRLKAINATNL